MNTSDSSEHSQSNVQGTSVEVPGITQSSQLSTVQQSLQDGSQNIQGNINEHNANLHSNVHSGYVAQGGKIYAEGTGVNPIIFTAEADDVTARLNEVFR